MATEITNMIWIRSSWPHTINYDNISILKTFLQILQSIHIIKSLLGSGSVVYYSPYQQFCSTKKCSYSFIWLRFSKLVLSYIIDWVAALIRNGTLFFFPVINYCTCFIRFTVFFSDCSGKPLTKWPVNVSITAKNNFFLGIT